MLQKDMDNNYQVELFYDLEKLLVIPKLKQLRSDCLNIKDNGFITIDQVKSLYNKKELLQDIELIDASDFAGETKFKIFINDKTIESFKDFETELNNHGL